MSFGKLLITGTLLAATFAVGCDPVAPRAEHNWVDYATVTGVYTDNPRGFVSGSEYSLTIMRPDGEVYTMGQVYGPPAVWKGFRGYLRVREVWQPEGCVDSCKYLIRYVSGQQH